MTQHSKASRVLVNELHASGELTGWSATKSCPLADSTALTATGATTEPGIVAGSISLKGLVTSAVTSLAVEAAAAAGTEQGLLVTVCPDGTAIGATVVTAACDLSSLTSDASVSAAVPLAIEAMPDAGIDWGVVLHDLTAETVDANAASVDNAAATSNGGVGVLHLTAFSGLTNVVMKIQHSTNNSTWADLATFSTATGATSQQVVVAAATTVNRYLRATTDVTGTGSTTPFVAFARR